MKLVKSAQPFDSPNAGSRSRRLSAIASRQPCPIIKLGVNTCPESEFRRPAGIDVQSYGENLPFKGVAGSVESDGEDRPGRVDRRTGARIPGLGCLDAECGFRWVRDFGRSDDRGGLNWYVRGTRNWRMTFDVTRINHSSAENLLTGFRAGESGTLFQFQMLNDF